MLKRYGKPYGIRGEQSTSFADLRDTPVILVAAFDNQWTMRIAGQLRFTFVDRLHAENTGWKLSGAWPGWDIPTDQAIVSRVLDTSTERPIVIAAGITRYGTMAAGEFLSHREYFADAVKELPRDWQRKNLQIVLRVPVVNRISGRPRILATHVW